MKATNIRQYSSIAARTLTIVGIIMILSSLLDFVVLSIPFNIGSRAWQIGLVTQLVDRGIIPMVGMALLFTGYWVSSNSGLQDNSTSSILDLRFWGLLLASLLGLMYLLLFPLHLNNTRIARAEAIERINQQASQAETQLEARVNTSEFQNQIQQRQTQLRNQFSTLLGDETRLNEALENEQISAPVKSLLEQSRENPQVIDEFLNRQAQQLPTQLLTRIRTRKQELQEQANTSSFKSSIRTGLSSLLLAIGYIMIGWTGLKNMGIIKGKGRRQNPAR
ncbi:MAG: HpsJ family protein [Cyanobacteriota bacterium]|nr:HpsJ family protein [Cyanobacteriota bacterium]